MGLVAASSARALVDAMADTATPNDATKLRAIEIAVRKRRVLDSLKFELPSERTADANTVAVPRGALLSAIAECRTDDLEDLAASVGVTLRKRRVYCQCCARPSRSPPGRTDMPVAALTVAAMPALGTL